MKVATAFIIMIALAIAHSQTRDHKFRLQFSSCNKQSKPQPLWSVMSKPSTDVYLALGDNIYADHALFLKLRIPASVEDIRQGYKKQADRIEYKEYLKTVDTVLAVWDDHDYGKNDGDKTWIHKDASRNLFFDFYNVPADSARRDHKGVYDVWRTEKAGLKIRIILLDCRYNKDVQESIIPKDHLPQDMLGQEQWRWLESELESNSADITIFASSIQVLADDKLLAEGWHKYPASLAKLVSLLVKTKTSVPIFLSGDIHFAEVNGVSLPFYHHKMVDFTSSGMTHAWAGPREMAVTWTVAGTRSLTPYYLDFNAGELEFEWNLNQQNQVEDGIVKGRILGINGTVRELEFPMIDFFDKPSTLDLHEDNIAACASSDPHLGLSSHCQSILYLMTPHMQPKDWMFVFQGYAILAVLGLMLAGSLGLPPLFFILTCYFKKKPNNLMSFIMTALFSASLAIYLRLLFNKRFEDYIVG